MAGGIGLMWAEETILAADPQAVRAQQSGDDGRTTPVHPDDADSAHACPRERDDGSRAVAESYCTMILCRLYQTAG